ncbi:MAG: response regulator transcription factor [Oscillospiraceae bacterium]
MKILIVEDDEALSSGIALSLGGNETVRALSLRAARELLDDSVELVILDINLPDGSGVDLCREIRRTSSVPIIFLTANDMELDIVTALESGGDDYITKPFSLAVLRARVNAVARRRENKPQFFSFGDYSFDFDNMKFTDNGTPVELSKTEQRLLKLFVNNIGRTLTRDMLIDKIWDSAEFVEENALSVTVKRLRDKLPHIPVKTVYGIGYVWEK